MKSENKKIFLTARWENLIIISFRVNPEVLNPYMPKGFRPDTINGDAFASLVAFDFLDTKVKGLKVPMHINFPEINLRFYVTNGEKRGVVFIREFVPRFFITIFANLLYNESYRALSMSNRVEKNDFVTVNHTIKFKSKEYHIDIAAENKPFMPASDSTEHFFKEHEWGFGTSRAGKPLIYKVEHPFWEVYPVVKFEHNFDFGVIYGEKWKSLSGESPYNVTLAKGSEVKVYSGEILK